jgi:hypothetical protein
MESFRGGDAPEPALAATVPPGAEPNASAAKQRAISRLRAGAGDRRLTAPEQAGAPRDVPRSDPLLIGLLIAAAAFLYAMYALRVGNFQNDEEQYMTLARYIAQHFPSALWQSGIYPRGTQRLDPLILAIPFALLRGPGAYQVAHVIQSTLFASTALPVFLLARRAGISRAAGLLAATLCVVVPWAVVATSFLAESATYPVYAWALYATWLTARRPSWHNDAFAVGTLILAALSRTAMLALAPMLPLAIIWHEWSWELRGVPRTRRVRALAHRLWSRHRLLTAVAGTGLLVVVADRLGVLPGRGLAALAGGYGLPRPGALASLLDRYRDYLSRLVAGTGFLALALALPWTLGTLIRPRDGERHAVAVVCTLAIGAILLSLLQAGPDERYILYGAAPIALATAAALSDWTKAPRPSSSAALGVLGGALVVVLLIDSVTWPGLTNAYDFFTYPAAIFYQRVLLGHAGLVHIPLVHLSPDSLIEAAILIGALVFVSAGRFPRAIRPVASLMAIGLVALCAAQMLYALRKFTATAGDATGPDAAARSWVDEHVPSGARVGALAVSTGEMSAYLPIWRTTEFWNTSVELDVFFGASGTLPFPLGSEAVQLKIQSPSGLLSRVVAHGGTSSASAPRYLLLPRQGTNRIGLEGSLVAEDSYLPLELVRLREPARVDWSISGTSDEGFLTSGEPATATVYSGALAGNGRRCATFSLISPPAFSGRWPYTVSIGRDTVRRGSLLALQTIAIDVPLPARTAGKSATEQLTVRVRGDVRFVNGLVVSAKLAFFAVGPCPTAGPSR